MGVCAPVVEKFEVLLVVVPQLRVAAKTPTPLPAAGDYPCTRSWSVKRVKLQVRPVPVGDSVTSTVVMVEAASFPCKF